MINLNNLHIKIFADGANKLTMLDMNNNPLIKGLTTNPTLMKKEGISNYSSFCKDILTEIKNKPISFEVFSDDFYEMEKQALEIASWGKNVYVKIPISNTQGNYSFKLIKKLSSQKVKLNVTAIMTLDQVKYLMPNLDDGTPSYVSIFAGRIADTCRDPLPVMSAALNIIRVNPLAELIWASPREVLNIIQADAIGCHIITVTNDIINKFKLLNYDLDTYSLDTVKMFHTDALEAGFSI